MMFDTNHIPIPLFILDGQGLLLDCNQAVEKMYGHKKEELVGALSEILAVDEAADSSLSVAVTSVLAGTKEERLITKHKTASGQILDVDLVLTPFNDDVDKAVLICVRDLTEQQRTHQDLIAKVERLQQKNNYLEQLANLDPLTGIYNRLYFNSRLESEVARAKRYRESLTLLMIDVDHFKSINDQYGHLVGDQVLVMVADKLKADLRRSDVLVRFGGEEFAIIAPNTNLQGGQLLAELTQARVRETTVCCFAQGTEVTVSIGIATLDFAEQDFEVEAAKHFLVKTADDKLYKAKNAGRNLIES